MKKIAASFLLFVIAVHLLGCTGLECKIGFVYNNTIGTCPADSTHCMAVTCTRAASATAYGYAYIAWSCESIRADVACANNTVKSHEAENITNVQCRCYYGKKLKNLSNVQYELPPVPESKTLNCKKGEFDSKEYGSSLSGVCNDEDNYCFMASCAKGNEHVKMQWGCWPNTSCAAISAEAGSSVNAAVTCDKTHDDHGKTDDDCHEESFGTKAEKLFATSEGPTTTNETEANRGPRPNFATFFKVPIVMLGGIFICAHSVLIGHHLNAA
uniref:Uncharacterized protein n=1 Tax=Globodera rostochiensis TaxID=31243 RepID=A0A914HAR4_GLORO